MGLLDRRQAAPNAGTAFQMACSAHSLNSQTTEPEKALQVAGEYIPIYLAEGPRNRFNVLSKKILRANIMALLLTDAPTFDQHARRVSGQMPPRREKCRL